MKIFGGLLFLAALSAFLLFVLMNKNGTQPASESITDASISPVGHKSEPSTASSSKLGYPQKELIRQLNQFVVRPADSSNIPESELNALLERQPVLDYEIVEINSDLLREGIRREGAESFASIDLLGQTVTLITEHGIEYAQGPRNGYAVWHGKIKNTDWSHASLRINPSGQVNGEIQGPGIGFVTIESLGEGSIHVIWSMDDTKIKEEME